ncbi:18339_t:CDS:10 [Dentiscutata erythropus]|uniref:18339_t:CDS:1 n=1 Tax=Dentiscutata erythropus TaxID=1348616 RepID=A0A9N8ZPS4_9GLOM|nr:18339_t:CDS:10 [Dentiscutata erythropus]
MDTQHLYKSTNVSFESFTLQGETINHEIQTEEPPCNDQELDDEEIATQGSIYHSEADPTVYIAWRVTESGHVLELRRFLIHSQDTNGDAVDQPGETTRAVRFKFSSNILPYVTFFTDPITRNLRCVVLLACRVLYRFDLPQRTLFSTRELPATYYSRFEVTLLQELTPTLVHAVDYENIVIGCTDGTIVYLQHQPLPHTFGVPENINDDNFTQVVLGKNLFGKMMKLVFPRQDIPTIDTEEDGSQEQPIAFASYVHGYSHRYLICLCRNRRVVIWSLKTRRYLESNPLSFIQDDDTDTDLNDSEDWPLDYNEPLNPLPPIPKKYIQALVSSNIHSPMTFHFVVFIPTSSDGYFRLYRVRVDASGGLREMSMIGQTFNNPSEQLQNRDFPFRNLVDMGLTHAPLIEESEPDIENGPTWRQEWRLWALWKRNRQAALTYTNFNITYYGSIDSYEDAITAIEMFNFGKRWEFVIKSPIKTHDHGYLANMLKDGDELLDHVQVCTDYLFCPGRFSTSIIKYALEKYIKNIVKDETEDFKFLNIDGDLKQKVKQVVAKHIRLRNDRENDIPLENEHKASVISEWLRFVLLCIEIQERASFPMSLSLVQNGSFVGITHQDSISLLRVCDILEFLQYYTGEEAHELSLNMSYNQLFPSYSIISEFEKIDMINVFAASNLVISPMTEIELLNFDRKITRTLSKPMMVSVAQSVSDLYDNHLRHRLTPDLKAKIWSRLDLCSQLDRTLQTIIGALNDVKYIIRERDEKIDTVKTTIFMDALIASAATDVIQSHYIIARNIFLLLVVILNIKPNSGHDQRVSMGMSTLYVHMILKWISEQSAYSDATTEATSEDGMSKRFSHLNMVSTARGVSESPDLRYSLLYSLIVQQYPLNLRFRSQSIPIIITRGVQELLDEIGFLPETPHLMVMAPETYAKFGHLLETSGYIGHLHQYVRLLLDTPANLYLHGKQLLKERKYDEAEYKFKRAGSGFAHDMTLPSYTAGPIIPSQDYIPGNLTAYYRHVAVLYENCEQPLHVINFCKLALEAFSNEQRQTPEGRTLVSQLYTKIFTNALKRDMFDLAYNAIVSNPNPTSQQANLRPFVRDMCEKKQVSKLLEFPFINFRRDFETILEFHARTHDIKETPNYSKICYTYYLSRRQNRDAARIMYQYANKVENMGSIFDNFQKGMTELASSYLSAINALEVLDKSLAWFHYNSLPPSDNVRARKRQKVDNELMNGDGEPITEVITITDLTKRYTMVMARLELGREFSDQVTPMKSQEAVKLCSFAGKFDLAISIAKLFEIPLDDVFDGMTRKCLSLINSNMTVSNMHKFSWVKGNGSTQFIHGTDKDKAWAMLRKYLDKYDKKEETLSRYRAVVLRTMLTVDSYVSIPEWLTSFYKTHNQVDHIRILLDFGRLSEATIATLDLIKLETDKHQPGKIASHCLPWNLIDSLMALFQDTLAKTFDPERKKIIEKLKSDLSEAFYR